MDRPYGAAYEYGASSERARGADGGLERGGRTMFRVRGCDGAWGPVDFVRMDDVDVSEDVDVPSHKTRSRSSEARTQHYGERDGWICGICWWPIDPEYWRLRAGPRFDSLRAHLKPEVDHVI